ncbi:hypothetical protein N2152v2_009498 [Parachlorella kessleri]
MTDLGAVARVGLTLSRPSNNVHKEKEQELKKAQLEQAYAGKLASKKAVLIVRADGEPEVLELKRLGKATATRSALLNQVLAGNEGEGSQLLRKLRARFDKAGVPINDVLVRFKDLTITGQVEIKTHKSPHLTQQLRDATKAVASMVLRRPPGNMRELLVLDGVSGILKPSRFTLLLGPPGSGKSVLMKSLAGLTRNDATLKVTHSELTYNGLSMDQFIPERTAAYVSQVDQHFGELTVRETLDFSARCQASGHRKSSLEQLEEAEKELGITPDPVLAAYMIAMQKAGRQNMITDLVLKTLDLDICAETVVGNAMLRGISGGQKKRVTTGEQLVGPTKVLFADEGTMLVSLLQPQPETFDLFDDVWVISSGKLVFQGPREFVLPFFTGLGFECPRLKGTADFLQEVNTFTDQERFWAGNPEEYRFIPAHEIAGAFYATKPGAAIIEELNEPAPTISTGQPQLATHKYGQSRMALLRANLRRQLTLTQRNTAFAVIRIFQCILMGVATGTLFLNTSKETLQDAQLFMAVGFFSVLYQLVGAFPASAILIDRLPVYYKQRDAHFYPGWAFALPEIILQLPLIFAESWIWTLLVYFLVGFSTSVRILVFWGFITVTSLWGLSLFMAVSAVARSHSIAVAVQSFIMLIFLVASGFIANPTSMPGGWIGAYYSNPIAWFIKGLLVNEMTSSDWDTPSSNLPGKTIGEEALLNRDYPTDYKTVWIGLFAWGIGSTFVNFVLFSVACTWLSSLKGTRTVPEEVVVERSLSKGQGLDKMAELVAMASAKAAATEHTNGHANGHTNGFANGHGDIEEGGHSGNGKKKSALPFKPLAMTFSDIKYSVPMPKGAQVAASQDALHAGQLLLLKGITGSFRPGVLTALMGASGAGKTTLMDVLAGRKTGGKITGDIRINGYPQNLKTFNRIVGYVEQTDVHIPEATVLEALLFSARLRLPSDTPDNVVVKFVDEMLDLVELTGIRNAQVGTPGLSGLSVEQRKRLTIGVELVANPSIVFMDEPTSGLDARAASVVMRAVRNTVNTGRTVVCTIHQPSLDIFLAFDELLLLKRGGETIFNGPMGKEAGTLIAYLSAIPGVPAIKPNYNPANYMLEVSSPEGEASTGQNFAEIYQRSELAESTAAQVESLSKPAEGVQDLKYEDMLVRSWTSQVKELFKRNWQQYARAYDYNVTRVLITFVIGMCFGTLFQNQGTEVNTFNGLINVAGALYMSVLFLGILDCFMVQNIILVRRAVYYREHAAGMYSVGPYIAAEFLVELPYVLFQSVIYSLLIYWMIGFVADAGKFFWFFMVMVLTLLYWTYFGINNVHVTPNEELARALGGFSFGFVNLFCGFLKPRSAIPKGWIWMYWINPLSYTLYALVVGQLGDNDSLMYGTGINGVQTVSGFVEDYFGYKWNFRWWCILIMVAYIFFFFFTSLLSLKKLNWQNR